MSYILGLDLGTNSIGWALISTDTTGKPLGIKDCGCRIFQEAVEAKTRTPKNQKRQAARSARRLTSRRKERRQKLTDCLIEYGILCDDQEKIHELLTSTRHDPYVLRAKALDEKISLDELSRVLMHINKRRGFKSNRNAQFARLAKEPEVQQLIKSEEKEEKVDKETSELKQKMADLKSTITNENNRTLGEYLANKSKKRVLFHPTRELYEAEFEKIWNKQCKYYPKVLTDDHKAQIAGIIFNQLPLKVQKHLVGKCTFEPCRKRAAKARLEYQEYRINEQVARLKILDPITMKTKELTDNQKLKLIDKLNHHGEVSFNGARKLLGLHQGERFNLETENNKKLLGNKTRKKLLGILGTKFEQLSATRINELMEDLLSILRKDVLYRRLRKHWSFEAEVAYKLATVEFESGYANLSLKAIKKIQSCFKHGLNYHDAVIEAGYLHDYQTKTKVVNELPMPDKTRNPVVDKALNETRKIINVIVARYGSPDKIRIELTRELKLSSKKLAELKRHQARNQKENEAAKIFLIDEKIYSNKDNIPFDSLLKYRLWKEANEHCPYSGEYISPARLFTSEVEIEHIIPFSRSLDNSYINKTICLSSENRTKNNQTPYEAYAGNNDRYESIKNRIKNFPMPKKRKFYQESVDEEKFVNRQLVDTSYISKQISEYLQILGCKVEATKGAATGFLRYRWGLNAILNGDNEGKNRSDHRHHALDAIIIALTTRSLLQSISREAKNIEQKNLRLSRLNVIEPWSSFRQCVIDAINNIIVSHARSTRVRGALHEDTIYGYDKGKKVYLIRKPLAHFDNFKKLEKVHDIGTREILKTHLVANENDFKRSFQNLENLPVDHNGNYIQKVRIREQKDKRGMITIEKQNGVIQHFSSGSNHHVAIFENSNTGDRKWKVMRRFDVAKRCHSNQPVFDKNDPDFPENEGWIFINYYSINDMFASVEEEHKVYRVQKISLNDITLQPHTYALAKYVKGETIALSSANSTKNYKKLNVDRLGKLA